MIKRRVMRRGPSGSGLHRHPPRYLLSRQRKSLHQPANQPGTRIFPRTLFSEFWIHSPSPGFHGRDGFFRAGYLPPPPEELSSPLVQRRGSGWDAVVLQELPEVPSSSEWMQTPWWGRFGSHPSSRHLLGIRKSTNERFQTWLIPS